MACLLWNDGQQSGCVDIFPGDGAIVGRSSLQGQEWFPRQLIEFIQYRGFWQIRRVSSSDWIEVQYFDGAAPLAERTWKSIGEVPTLIDDNTMIRVVLDTFMMKLIFIDDLNCQSASMIGHMWVSRLWSQPIVERSSLPIEKPVETTKPMPLPETDQRIMGWLDWLAGYLKDHGVLAVASLLIVAATAIGLWYLSGHTPEPMKLEKGN